MPWKATIKDFLTNKFDKPIQISSVHPVGGGSINSAYGLETNVGKFFVKLNSASRYPGMFKKEAMGLKILSDAGELPVPEIVGFGENHAEAFLVLKFIETGTSSAGFWENFGHALARLHGHSADSFGLDHDNYIGSLPQRNTFHNTWETFFVEERLQPLMHMAFDNKLLNNNDIKAFKNFFGQIDTLFPKEPPALLHGDLWGGNFMTNQAGEAVLIDPAVYFGHREMDLGMSQLFGGFHHRFYDAYTEAYPLEPGWEKRLDYCNLYPLLVHVNLFGGSYVGSVQRILQPFT